jgi:hypothetical protein
VLRDRTVIFGGHWTLAGAPLADTWELDGGVWVPSSATGPAARSLVAMAYDEAAARVVLFGGALPGPFGVYHGPLLNDTWLWDGTTWTLAVPTSSPSPRVGAAMAYDEDRQRVVLFGGFANSSYLDDTWEWDGTDWTLVQPASRPPGMSMHSMTYDSVRRHTVLCGSGTRCDLAWAWNGTTWTVLPAVPSATVQAADQQVVFDRERGRCVLVRSTFVSSSVLVRSTWEFDGTTWTHQPSPVQPQAVTGVAVTFDRRRARVIAFGGRDSGQGHHDTTWTWSVPGLAVAQPYGTGCGSPPLTATPDPAARPVLGGTQRVAITNAPLGFAAMAAGFSSDWFGGVPLPMPLSVIGMTGCQLLQSHDLNPLGCTQTGATTAEYTLPIPPAAALAGFAFFLQPWALAPGEPGGLTIANGIAVTIGTL